MGIKSYRVGRNRRVAQPGTPGGIVKGVNVCAYEFRADASTFVISVHVVAADGNTQAAELLAEVGQELPTAGIKVYNADSPGDPVTIASATVTSPNTVEFFVEDLPAENVGTVLIPPMLAGWGDAYGRVFGGLYSSIPPI